MTACDDDADCFGEKICSPSYKCVAPQFSRTMAMWVVAFLIFVGIVGYVWLRSVRNSTNGVQDIMQSIGVLHSLVVVHFEGIVKDSNGQKIVVKRKTSSLLCVV